MAAEYLTKQQTIELLEGVTDIILKTFKDYKAWMKDLEARGCIDDIQAEYDGERRLSLKFVMGNKVKSAELVLPIPIDRGVYNEDQAYERGDTVSSGGSLWIAQHKSIGQKPGTSGAFRLAAKKGKDGRDDGRTT